MDALELFRHRSVLALLVIPLALLIWTWRRRGRGLVLPFDHSGAAHGPWLAFFLRCAESLPAVLLALVILILAGPQKWDEPRSKRVMTNIEFCVDISGSMTARFDSGTRYDAAMMAINAFLDFRKGDAFGLTFFGSNVLHWVPLTTDVSAFRCAPPFMRPGTLPYWFNGTQIAKALMACRGVLLAREEGDRMIVLITDGYSADLDGGTDEIVARRLKADNITVFAVHIADGNPAESLERIASITGGEVFAPGDREGLVHVFERIDKMQKTRMEKTHAEAADDFWPWCLAGLGVLGCALLALFGLRYTPW